MCIGVPLQVRRRRGQLRLVRGRRPARTARHDARRRAARRAPGCSAFHGAARQVLSEAEAAAVARRTPGAGRGARGDADVDAFFADLIGREPAAARASAKAARMNESSLRPPRPTALHSAAAASGRSRPAPPCSMPRPSTPGPSEPGAAMVVFAEDPERYKETLDLAVIVPELHAGRARALSRRAAGAGCGARAGIALRLRALAGVRDAARRPLRGRGRRHPRLGRLRRASSTACWRPRRRRPPTVGIPVQRGRPARPPSCPVHATKERAHATREHPDPQPDAASRTRRSSSCRCRARWRPSRCRALPEPGPGNDVAGAHDVLARFLSHVRRLARRRRRAARARPRGAGARLAARVERDARRRRSGRHRATARPARSASRRRVFTGVWREQHVDADGTLQHDYLLAAPIPPVVGRAGARARRADAARARAAGRRDERAGADARAAGRDGPQRPRRAART